MRTVAAVLLVPFAVVAALPDEAAIALGLAAVVFIAFALTGRLDRLFAHRRAP